MVWVLTAAEQDRRHRLLLGSVDYVLAAVISNGHDLQYASAEMRNNKTVVEAAVQTSGLALAYASEEMKNSKTVVLAAVQQDGHALFHGSREMKNTETVVLAAVRQDGSALVYASEELKTVFFITQLYLARATGAAATSNIHMKKQEQDFSSKTLVEIPRLMECDDDDDDDEDDHASLC